MASTIAKDAQRLVRPYSHSEECSRALLADRRIRQVGILMAGLQHRPPTPGHSQGVGDSMRQLHDIRNRPGQALVHPCFSKNA
ncbi:MAG TPA: hypothetical protein DD856_18230 [Sulfobacillus sp.]|nr:hypothetical protein [Sulfobacillus sp.]